VIRISPLAGQTLQGKQLLGSFCLAAVAGQASGFQPLTITNILAQGLDGVAVADCRAASAPLDVVSDQALLESVRGSSGQLVLILHGLVGTGYVIESASSLPPVVQWQTMWDGVFTNTEPRRAIKPTDTAEAMRFYRALEL